jgi:hypothetical protein
MRRILDQPSRTGLKRGMPSHRNHWIPLVDNARPDITDYIIEDMSFRLRPLRPDNGLTIVRSEGQ